jgi:hypothetical protein
MGSTPIRLGQRMQNIPFPIFLGTFLRQFGKEMLA